jgi:predicted HTH transcriptional regulator
MIKIRDESDFRNWFKKNYKKLGFSKILESSTLRCPDFIVLENGKKIRIELEIKTSNFMLHGHSKNDVDKVLCIIEDVPLDIPTIKVDTIRLMNFEEGESRYSTKFQIYRLFRKNKILTTSEVSSLLQISKGAAERNLLKLTVDGKIERIKKEGLNLWLSKEI